MKNYYIKDAYQDPSDKRNIDYLQDKSRTTTQYTDEYIKHDSTKTKLNSTANNFKNTLKKYEYSHHDDSIRDIITEGRKKNEQNIRDKL